VAILAMKIRQAYRMGTKNEVMNERGIMDVMVPIEEYTVLNSGATVREAILALKVSFVSKIATGKLMETGHRSILVLDDEKHLVGLLTIRDLIKSVMPSYLAAPKPSTADSMQYSPMFWKGLFTDQVMQLPDRTIDTIMSPAPNSIYARANLMEAAYIMSESGARRLAVFIENTLIGVIREQDLFFEMDRILHE
jgi:CBS domain-containing protein